MITKVAFYVGRRITVKGTLAYFWKFDGEDDAGGYKAQLAPAVIGEQWEFQFTPDGKIYRDAKQTKVYASPEQTREWSAKDVAHANQFVQRRMTAKLAKRASDFEQYMRPLQSMMLSLNNHEDRAAFVQAVVSRLWRR